MKKGKGKTKPKPAKPLTEKEIKKQLKSGKLTGQQAIALRQKYMDTLEYNEAQAE